MLQNYPQKDVFVLKLPTQKRCAGELPTENRNCLFLPTKVDFLEKVPTEQRKSLGLPIFFVWFGIHTASVTSTAETHTGGGAVLGKPEGSPARRTPAIFFLK